MTADQLLLDLVNAGLKVRQYDGWETRGGTWRRGKPVGVMHHHTAAPVPYPVPRLAGSLLKANMNTKPNGEVWLIAYRACNFSSGSGSSVVLNEVLAGTPPTHNAKTRGLDDDTNGNPYFWNFENDHAGTGGPLPGVQERAITVATQVVNNHFGLTADNTISHAEWTYRKQDPYWNGDRRAIETIRQQVGDDMPTIEEIRQAIREEAAAAVWAPGQNPDGSYYYTINGVHPNTLLRAIKSDLTAVRAKLAAGIDLDTSDTAALVAAVIQAIEDLNITVEVQAELNRNGPS